MSPKVSALIKLAIAGLGLFALVRNFAKMLEPDPLETTAVRVDAPGSAVSVPQTSAEPDGPLLTDADGRSSLTLIEGKVTVVEGGAAAKGQALAQAAAWGGVEPPPQGPQPSAQQPQDAEPALVEPQIPAGVADPFKAAQAAMQAQAAPAPPAALPVDRPRLEGGTGMSEGIGQNFNSMSLGGSRKGTVRRNAWKPDWRPDAR